MDLKIRRIFLTGFRGSGKTTLGRILAKKLGFKFLDTDELIVKKKGKSIAKITKNGKNWYPFRKLEHQILKDLIKKEKIVVATGGGMFVNEVKFSKRKTFGRANFDLIKNLEKKIVIFLKIDEKALEKRLKKDLKYNLEWRPSLLRGKENDIEKEKKIYRKRLPLYEKRCDFVVSVSKQKPKDCVKKILKILCQYQQKQKSA
jgi:shikimate kinase